MTNAQHFVSKKQIDGVVYYRVHDIWNNELVGIRCVAKQKNGKLRMVNDSRFVPGLSDFLNDTGNIVALQGEAADRILAFLREQEGVVADNFRQLMGAMESGGYVTAVQELGGEQFGFVTEREDGAVVRLYHVIGGESGKVAYFGALHPALHLPRIVTHLLDEDTDNVVYQTGDGEFLGIRSLGDNKVVLSISHRTEEDSNYFVGNEGDIKRYSRTEADGWELAMDDRLTLRDVQPALDGIMQTLQEAFGFTLT